MPAPPTPLRVLRLHSAQVNCLFISDDNERLYSGDASGLVVCTSTRTFRPLASWKPHSDSVLGVEEWDGQVITHARDNKMHVWTSIVDLPVLVNSASTTTLPEPTLIYSLDVNALNYCRFSLLSITVHQSQPRALLAVPNLIESSHADIWELPSRARIDAAVGTTASSQGDGRGGDKTGIIMSMHLFESPQPVQSTSFIERRLMLLTAFENGSVTLWARRQPLDGELPLQKSVEGKGWDSLWNRKLHVESIMGTAISRDRSLALSVAADHFIGRYVVPGLDGATSFSARTKHVGNAAITIRDDGRVCTVAGWDGKIRIYSTKTLKPLGSLDYHKESCQVVIFLRTHLTPSDGADNDDEMDEQEREARGRWVISGGKDGKIVIWELGTFERG